MSSEKQAKLDVETDNDKDKFDFLPKPLFIVLGSGICLVILLILLILPSIQLGIGAAYVNQCTINPNIPVYSIVAGSCGIATILLMLITIVVFICLIKGNSTGGMIAAIVIVVLMIVLITLMSLFLFAWSIVGGVWVFGAKANVVHDDSSSSNYCQRTLYDFSFAIVIINYVMFGLSCLSSCCGSSLTSKSSK